MFKYLIDSSTRWQSFKKSIKDKESLLKSHKYIYFQRKRNRCADGYVNPRKKRIWSVVEKMDVLKKSLISFSNRRILWKYQKIF
jgi:hypothetical protein